MSAGANSKSGKWVSTGVVNHTRLLHALRDIILAQNRPLSFSELDSLLLASAGRRWSEFALPERSDMQHFILEKCEGKFILHEAEGQDARVSCAPALLNGGGGGGGGGSGAGAGAAAPAAAKSLVSSDAELQAEQELLTILRTYSASDSVGLSAVELGKRFQAARGGAVSFPQMFGCSFSLFLSRRMTVFDLRHIDGEMWVRVRRGGPGARGGAAAAAGAGGAASNNGSDAADSSATASSSSGPSNAAISAEEVSQDLVSLIRAHSTSESEGMILTDLSKRFRAARGQIDFIQRFGCGFMKFMRDQPDLFELYDDGIMRVRLHKGGGIGAAAGGAGAGAGVGAGGGAYSPSSSAAATPASPSSDPPGFKDGRPFRVVPCKFFFKQGHCPNGDACTWLHGNPDQNQQQAAMSTAPAPMSLADSSDRWRKSAAPAAAPSPTTPLGAGAAAPATTPSMRSGGGGAPTAELVQYNTALASLTLAEQTRLMNAVRELLMAHDNSVRSSTLQALFLERYGMEWSEFAGPRLGGVGLASFVRRHVPVFFHMHDPGMKLGGSLVSCVVEADGSLPPPRVLGPNEGNKLVKSLFTKQCEWFAAGECKRGADCTYRHDPIAVAAPTPASIPRSPPSAGAASSVLSPSVVRALCCLREVLRLTGPRPLLIVSGTLHSFFGPRLFAKSLESFVLAHASYFVIEQQTGSLAKPLIGWNEQGPALDGGEAPPSRKRSEQFFLPMDLEGLSASSSSPSSRPEAAHAAAAAAAPGEPIFSPLPPSSVSSLAARHIATTTTIANGRELNNNINSNKINTPPASAGAGAGAGVGGPPSHLAAIMQEAPVTFSAPPGGAHIVAPIGAPAAAAAPMSASVAPHFESQPPAHIGMDIHSPAYSHWYYARGPGSVSTPGGHTAAPGMSYSSSSSASEEKKQMGAPAVHSTTAAASSAASTASSSSTSGSTSAQSKLVRVLVHVAGLAKPVKVAAESIEELRRELGETVDDEDVLSADALATVIFSTVQPCVAAPSPTPLTDDALWALDKNTPLHLSWAWCAASFKIQSLLNPSITRQSTCIVCKSKLSHPKHDKLE